MNVSSALRSGEVVLEMEGGGHDRHSLDVFRLQSPEDPHGTL